MNKDEQIEEYEISFYTFIFEEEDNKELKKNDIKRKDNFGFAIFFLRRDRCLSLTFMNFVI